MGIQSDLLPASIHNRAFMHTAAKCWACIWILTGLAAFSICLGQQRLVTSLESNVARIDAQASPLRKIRSDERRMRKQIVEIQQRESLLTESDSGQTLQLLGIISRAAAETNGRINVGSMKVFEFDRPVKIDPPLPVTKSRNRPKIETERRMQMDLSGLAVDDLAVAAFVAMLREINVFETVELKSTVSEVVNAHETRKYELSCVY